MNAWVVVALVAVKAATGLLTCGSDCESPGKGGSLCDARRI